MLSINLTHQTPTQGANILAAQAANANSFAEVKFIEAANRGFSPESVSEGSPDMEGEEPTLEETAEQEQEYLRRRLRDELQREPTEDELNEWLRQHTEGY